MRRTMASSLGKMPTTSVRRLISPLRRSIGKPPRRPHRTLTADRHCSIEAFRGRASRTIGLSALLTAGKKWGWPKCCSKATDAVLGAAAALLNGTPLALSIRGASLVTL